jgi:hypothetical protein
MKDKFTRTDIAKVIADAGMNRMDAATAALSIVQAMQAN